tara:strand:+ start:240 stop:482 length:243 start_codon:yes stop_codon:yes gene_type:complete
MRKMWDNFGRWRGWRPVRKLKAKETLDYIKEQFFDSYEGEWEEMLQEAHLHLYPDYDPHEVVAYITVVDVRLEGVNDAEA